MRIGKGTIAFVSSVAFVSAGLIAGHAGYVINETASVPRGIWKIDPVQGPIERGSVVVVCPPEPVGRLALERGYITNGPCPGGLERLLKPVAAIGGDVISVTASFVAVNYNGLPDTAQMGTDTAGRPMPTTALGRHEVAPDEVWVSSGHEPTWHEPSARSELSLW